MSHYIRHESTGSISAVIRVSFVDLPVVVVVAKTSSNMILWTYVIVWFATWAQEFVDRLPWQLWHNVISMRNSVNDELRQAALRQVKSSWTYRKLLPCAVTPLLNAKFPTLGCP